MSQRALKKRELSLQRHEKKIRQIYHKQPQPSTTQKFKYPQWYAPHSIRNVLSNSSTTKLNQIDRNNVPNAHKVKQKYSSTPNLTTIIESDEFVDRNQLVRSHSESDLANIPESNVLTHAKSEFHLKSIASTRVPQLQNSSSKERQITSGKKSTTKKWTKSQSNLLSMDGSMQGIPRMTSSTSQLNLVSTVDGSDTEKIHVPIIGYEVMEERARFTVFKLRIHNQITNDCWMVLRRYNDFQRLNNKIKSMYPHVPSLTLPRKKLFGDNFSSMFLSNRVKGLQTFINAVLANDVLRHSKAVRDFFSLDEPPTYAENIEDCRAIFEAQEETINHLKAQLRAKDEAIMSLQKQLNSEIEKNQALSTAIRYSYDNCANCSERFDDLMSFKVIINEDK